MSVVLGPQSKSLKSKYFWPTIKPFLTKKGSDGRSEIIVCENEKNGVQPVRSHQIFSDCFVNVAKDIGNSSKDLTPISRTTQTFKRLKKIPQSRQRISHLHLFRVIQMRK